MKRENPEYQSWALESLRLRGKRAQRHRFTAASITSLATIIGIAVATTYTLAKKTDERLKKNAEFYVMADARSIKNGLFTYTTQKKDSYFKLYNCERNHNTIDSLLPSPERNTIESYKQFVVNLQLEYETDAKQSPLRPRAYALHPNMNLILPDLNGDKTVGCAKQNEPD